MPKILLSELSPPQKRELWEKLQAESPDQAQAIKEAMAIFAEFAPSPLLDQAQVQALLPTFKPTEQQIFDPKSRLPKRFQAKNRAKPSRGRGIFD